MAKQPLLRFTMQMIWTVVSKKDVELEKIKLLVERENN